MLSVPLRIQSESVIGGSTYSDMQIYILQGRELLMRMFEVFVLKFKSIAEIQMPVLLQKW